MQMFAEHGSASPCMPGSNLWGSAADSSYEGGLVFPWDLQGLTWPYRILGRGGGTAFERTLSRAKPGLCPSLSSPNLLSLSLAPFTEVLGEHWFFRARKEFYSHSQLVLGCEVFSFSLRGKLALISISLCLHLGRNGISNIGRTPLGVPPGLSHSLGGDVTHFRLPAGSQVHDLCHVGSSAAVLRKIFLEQNIG